MYLQIQEQEEKTKSIRNKIINSIVKAHKHYLFSITQSHKKSVRLTFKKFIFKTSNLNSWLNIRIYYKRKLIFKIDIYDFPSYNNINYSKFDFDYIIEMTEFHNIFVDKIHELFLIKDEKLEKINNFNLALKELEV